MEHNQQFETFTTWVNKASSWLTRRGKEVKAICFDAAGNICNKGGDFSRADKNKNFPVHWIWPDQIPELFFQKEKLLPNAVPFESIPAGWRLSYIKTPEKGDGFLAVLASERKIKGRVYSRSVADGFGLTIKAAVEDAIKKTWGK